MLEIYWRIIPVKDEGGGKKQDQVGIASEHKEDQRGSQHTQSKDCPLEEFCAEQKCPALFHAWMGASQEGNNFD